MSMRTRVVLLVVLAMVVVACGGAEGDSPTTTPVDGSTTPTSAPGSTSSAPAPTTQPEPPGGSDEGSVTVEIDGTTHELSVRKDIEFWISPGTMFPTRCEPNFFGQGLFWVIAIELDEDGKQVEEGWTMEASLYANGELEEDGFGMERPATEEEYNLDTDNPGTWTISGNRLQGEVNVTYFENGQTVATTARLDFTCPTE